MTSDSLFSSGRYQHRHRVDRFCRGGCAPIYARRLLGCEVPDVVEKYPDDYRTSHPINIDEKLFTMDIPVGLDTARLTTPVKGNIVGFAQRFNASDSDLMVIVAPSGSPNQSAAADMSRKVRDVLVNAGISPGRSNSVVTAPVRMKAPRQSGSPTTRFPPMLTVAAPGPNIWRSSFATGTTVISVARPRPISPL